MRLYTELYARFYIRKLYVGRLYVGRLSEMLEVGLYRTVKVGSTGRLR
jgi:hypothetical protein